ncbi:hypothetical protein GOP47_0017972 [Adiantum capillus-veneris]|uniref:Uncharacterized protein n=1 Tax=Adiantum capillus-veneris TaxID=13818 RepID=A0A9D4UGE9_ADICA|nr:hypothetical protein GOP47_0017972 [Adiantum capillus-veneris]
MSSRREGRRPNKLNLGFFDHKIQPWIDNSGHCKVSGPLEKKDVFSLGVSDQYTYALMQSAESADASVTPSACISFV